MQKMSCFRIIIFVFTLTKTLLFAPGQSNSQQQLAPSNINPLRLSTLTEPKEASKLSYAKVAKNPAQAKKTFAPENHAPATREQCCRKKQSALLKKLSNKNRQADYLSGMPVFRTCEGRQLLEKIRIGEIVFTNHFSPFGNDEFFSPIFVVVVPKIKNILGLEFSKGDYFYPDLSAGHQADELEVYNKDCTAKCVYSTIANSGNQAFLRYNRPKTERAKNRIINAQMEPRNCSIDQGCQYCIK